MFVNRVRGVLLCCAVLLALLPAGAQQSDYPAYTVLKCETGCARRTPPTPDGEHRGYFPRSEMTLLPQYQSEAFVLIRFTITADGAVKDPMVEKLIGPQDFADGSLKRVREWRYHPATIDGKPVPTYNWITELTYTFNPPELGARAKVYDAYRNAQSLMQDGKFAEANAVLLPILTIDRLNFYERSMVSFLLAIDEVQLKDYLTAREYIENATLMDGKFVGPKTLPEVIRWRIRIDGMTGQYGDAMEWFETLKKRDDVKSDSPETKLMENIQKRLADPKPIFLAGRIPEVGLLGIWNHTLLRRTFAFPKIEGKLDRFQLRCDQQEIVSAISDKAEWHVPKNWSNCQLEVFGEPNALFQLAETVD